MCAHIRSCNQHIPTKKRSKPFDLLLEEAATYSPT